MISRNILAKKDGTVERLALNREGKGLTDVEIVKWLDQEIHCEVRNVQERSLRVLICTLAGIIKMGARDVGEIELTVLICLIRRRRVGKEEKNDLLQLRSEIEVVRVGNKVDLLLV